MFFDQTGLTPATPPEFIEIVRIINICIGTIASLCLFYAYTLKWRTRETAEKLRWMSVLLFVISGTYGTFEAAYLDTFIRVYMVTVSLLWAIAAALWPSGAPKSTDGT